MPVSTFACARCSAQIELHPPTDTLGRELNFSCGCSRIRYATSAVDGEAADQRAELVATWGEAATVALVAGAERYRPVRYSKDDEGRLVVGTRGTDAAH